MDNSNFNKHLKWFGFKKRRVVKSGKKNNPKK